MELPGEKIKTGKNSREIVGEIKQITEFNANARELSRWFSLLNSIQVCNGF